MKLNKAKSQIAFIVAITTLLGTAFTVDNRYAKQTQTQEKIDSVEQTIQKVEQRLDKKILKDRANVLQERIWKYEDRYEDKPMPDSIKEVIRDLQKEFDDVTKELDKQKE
jgi:replicative DNA helicase